MHRGEKYLVDFKETLKKKIIVTTKLGKTNVERQRKKGSKSLSVPVAIGSDSSHSDFLKR